MSSSKEIYDFLFETKNAKGKSGLHDFRDLVREQNTDPQNRFYISLIKELSPYLNKRNAPLKTEGFGKESKLNSQRQDFMRKLDRVPEGRGKAFTYGIIDWFLARRCGEIKVFLENRGFEDEIETGRQISYDAFLSWSGEYGGEIASAVKRFLDSIGGVETFLSSESIGSGVWRQKLEDGLLQSAHGLVIYTQDSIDSEYIDYEFAALSHYDPQITILLFNCSEKLLPTTMEQFQYKKFQETELRTWISDVLGGKEESVTAKEFEKLFSEISDITTAHSRTYVTDETSRWVGYGRPLLFPAQETSPYDLEECIKVAQQDLVLVAQNHWFMTNADKGGDERFWPLFEDALARNVNVTIIGMHESAIPPKVNKNNCPSASDVWSLYMESPGFKEQAKNCWNLLEKWSDRWQEMSTDSGLGRLSIWGAYFLPFSIKFIDRNSERGVAILSPRLLLRGSAERPEIVIRKSKERSAFQYFQRAIEYSLYNPGDSGWRQMFAESSPEIPAGEEAL
ncbi:TIR domain-containing protein [Parvularcula flava]|uniref:TIR domain-containing protein n=1 Tax=Aquisalinus luteolus TaxID=1566827 RepID=A0A8J3ABH8_9PROT|nr:TIR domain-containing protein [Aquisalinus luteolus]NHK29621.1 TIR domain-containing protein [Aquisalinus luteolus]GGI02308.1 hypothetical protein GCM10011355_35010 [Aquisalinus luteolus]